MPKLILPALAFLLFLPPVARAEDPAVPPKILDRCANAISATLPAGYAVRIDADGTGIWIERKQIVHMLNNAPSQGGHLPGDPPLMGAPNLFLRVRPPQSQAQLATLLKSNADREKALEMLRHQLADLPNNAKPSWSTEGYVALTPDQKARLEAFATVKQSLPEIPVPELFAPDASFILSSQTWIAPADEAVRTELADVREKVAALFSKNPLY